MKLQMKDSEKIKHVDYVIENNSTKSELYNSVDKLIKTIKCNSLNLYSL